MDQISQVRLGQRHRVTCGEGAYVSLVSSRWSKGSDVLELDTESTMRISPQCVFPLVTHMSFLVNLTPGMGQIRHVQDGNQKSYKYHPQRFEGNFCCT